MRSPQRIAAFGAFALLTLTGCFELAPKAHDNPYDPLSPNPYVRSWNYVGTARFSPGSAECIDIAVDKGVPYVSYQDGNNANKIIVQKHVAASGTWSTVGTAGFSGIPYYNTSLVLYDNAGTLEPYVAFSDISDSYRAKCFKFTAGSWTQLDNASWHLNANRTSQYVALAFLSGVPYVAVEDYNDTHTSGFKFQTGSWTALGNTNFMSNADFISAAVSSDGYYYVGGKNHWGPFKGSVMRYNGSAWAYVGSRDFTAGPADWFTLALDENNVPYVAYVDGAIGSKAAVKKYTGGGATGWVDVGTAGFNGANSITGLGFAIHKTTPYVAFKEWDGSKWVLRVMKYDSSWISVGTTGFNGGSIENSSLTKIAIVVDAASATPFVAFQDDYNNSGSSSTKITVMKFD